MPVLLFTANEVANTLIARQRELSDQILKLSDTKVMPLDPGESITERYRKIAKLGKQLAHAFDTFDTLMRGTVAAEKNAEEASDNAPEVPDTSQAN